MSGKQVRGKYAQEFKLEAVRQVRGKVKMISILISGCLLATDARVSLLSLVKCWPNETLRG